MKRSLALWGQLARVVFWASLGLHLILVLLENLGVQGLREGAWYSVRTVVAIAFWSSIPVWGAAALMRHFASRS
jgi:hypothetical protein